LALAGGFVGVYPGADFEILLYAFKVEVIVEDSQGKPDVALTKLRKLVENDKVQVLLGEVFAHIGYAMAPRVDEYKVPMLYPVIAADDLTQRKPAKWVVRTG
jgi:branched-chain amino acid transport system substrate-binding protein